MTFEPKHNADQLGPLVADPADEATPGGTLCSLADLVAWVMYRDAGMPRRPAATLMVDKLGVPAPPLYLTNRDTWATRLPALHEWWQKDDGSPGVVVRQLVKASAYRATGLGGSAYEPGPWQMLGGSGGASRYQERCKVVKPRAAMPGVYGEAGAWQVLRDAWCSDDKATSDKAMKRHGSTLARLAIPMSVATALFGYERTAELAADPGQAVELQKLPDRDDGPTPSARSADVRIVHPDDGEWPKPRKGWTTPQLAAVRKMIAAGMGNQEIANAVGVTRQAIAEKFGSDKNRCAIGSFAMLAAAVVKS